MPPTDPERANDEDDERDLVLDGRPADEAVGDFDDDEQADPGGDSDTS